MENEEVEEQQVPSDVQQDYMASQLREETTNLVREQLSLENELETIENLLRGNILTRNEKGIFSWEAPVDPDMIILTEHGVHLIMNTIMFYLNKNTLLSNYEEKLINTKMEDFATSLSDTIFMEYEKVFKYPTQKECEDKLNERIKRKTDLRMFALQLAGKAADEKEVKESFVKEIESRIEEEIEKIKEQVIKNKLKRFEILIREVQDAVHSTYLRAWNGQERRTLRQHIHIQESNTPNANMNPMYNQPNKKGFFKR